MGEEKGVSDEGQKVKGGRGRNRKKVKEMGRETNMKEVRRGSGKEGERNEKNGCGRSEQYRDEKKRTGREGHG